MKKSIEYDIRKESILDKEEVLFTIKIRVKKDQSYQGFDLFPDDKIGDLLVAVGRLFDHDRR